MANITATTTAANPQVGNPILSTPIIPMLALFVIFYFLLIRPQRQREKEHQKMLKGIEKNDEVVTTGGIHGTVINVKEKTFILRVDDNVKLEVERNCVSFVEKKQS